MTDTRVGYELKRTQHALRITMDDTLREWDLTTPQYAVLTALMEEPGQSSAELARGSFVTPQTMNGIVQNLEERGLVMRQQHPNFGRILQAFLTPEGEALTHETKAIIDTVETQMTRLLSEDERRALVIALRKCREALAVDESRYVEREVR